MNIVKKLRAMRGAWAEVIGSSKADDYLNYRAKLDAIASAGDDNRVARLHPSAARNKLVLLDMIEAGELKPQRSAKYNRDHQLGNALKHYTTEGSQSYDPEFDLWIRMLSPSWFDRSYQNKRRLLEMAQNGQPCPDRDHTLGRPLRHYITEGDDSYDPSFTKRLQQIQPDWLIARVPLSEENILAIRAECALDQRRSYAAIGKQYGIGGAYVSQIARGDKRTDVGGEITEFATRITDPELLREIQADARSERAIARAHSISRSLVSQIKRLPRVDGEVHRGERGGRRRAKLSDDQVTAIRRELAGTKPRLQRDIAAEYGVRQGYISQIKNNQKFADARDDQDAPPHPKMAIPPAFSKRTVITPDGVFPNLNTAAESAGINYKAAHARIAQGLMGWTWGPPPDDLAVVTPDGQFANIGDAMAHYGIPYGTAYNRATFGRVGWGWVDSTRMRKEAPDRKVR